MDINEVIKRELSKNKLMSTFVGGMNTDTSDAFIADSQYRYAENVRVITESNNNSGELRLIEGTYPLRFNVQLIIKNDDHDPQETTIDSCEILALASIRDIAVIITKRKVSGYWGWDVYKFVGNEILNQQNPHAYHIIGTITNRNAKDGENNLLWDEKDTDGGNINNKPLSIVMRYENDNNIKMYIADGIHQTMMIRLEDNYYQGNDFKKLFLQQEQILLPARVSWSDKAGSIMGPVIQYAYRLYKKGEAPSSISILSEPLVDYKDGLHGYAPNNPGGRAVVIRIPSANVPEDEYMQVYRISYQKMANLPTIHLIYDNKYKTTDIYDYGSNVQEVSNDEFLAMDLLKVVPKQIESKGDYLLSANVKYTTDDVDELFKNFDARCYTSTTRFDDEYGDAVINNYGKIEQDDIPVDQTFYHPELSNNTMDYNPENWFGANIDTINYNGVGKTFAWRYVYNTRTIDTSRGDANDPKEKGRTYRRGDVYRFGVILYDKRGNRSSVKWIADIKMPPANAEYQHYNIKPLIQDFLSVTGGTLYNSIGAWVQNDIGIEFVPINSTDIDSPWKDVYGYQIVQCPRSVYDKHILFLGICGHPLLLNSRNSNPLAHPGYLTPCNQWFVNSYWDAGGHDDPDTWQNTWQRIYNWDLQFNGGHIAAQANTASGVVLFACPEYTVQKDDVKELLKNSKNKLELQFVDMYKSAYSKTNQEILFTDSHNETRNVLFPYLYGRVWDDYNQDRRDVVYHSPQCSKFAENTEGCNEYGANPILAGTTIKYWGGPAEQSFENGYMFDTPFIDYITRWSTLSVLEYNVSLEDAYHLTWAGYGNRLGFFTYPARYNESIPLGGSATYGSRYSFVIPASKIGMGGEDDYLSNKKIKDISYVESPDPSSFASRSNYYSQDHRTIIDNQQYINWHAPVQYLYSNKEGLHANTNGEAMADYNSWAHLNLSTFAGDKIAMCGFYGENLEALILGAQFPIGAGSDLLLIKLNNGNEYKSTFGVQQGLPPIWIQNIVNSSNTPYGGYNFNAVDNSTYMDTPYMSKRSVAGELLSSNRCFYGDCQCKPFFYYATHYWRNYDVELNKLAITYIVPIETEVDLQGNSSTYLSPTEYNGYDIRLQDKPTSIGGFNQSEPPYIYNTAYGVMPNLFSRNPADSNTQSNNYDVRVHYSLNKTNGEYIDSWSVNKPADFIDVDSRFGSINMLKLYKDKLLFWQDHATGMLSVNDRTIIKDEDTNAIQLGTGNVLERYDYITTLYGMKPNQQAVAVSDGAVYWWDGYQKEILNHVSGYTVTPLSTVKNVKNYINTGDENDVPSVIYDKKYKEVLFNVTDNYSLVYSEHTSNFTSVYTFSPIFYCDLDNVSVITSKYVEKNEDEGKNQLHRYNVSDGSAKLFSQPALPQVKFVVNDSNMYNKVFDNQTFNGKFYDIDKLSFHYDTPLKQHSWQTGDKLVTDIEYDYKLAIPRNGESPEHEVEYGDRMRGKTMNCTIKSDSNDLDFSLQYVITKYRVSWT